MNAVYELLLVSFGYKVDRVNFQVVDTDDNDSVICKAPTSKYLDEYIKEKVEEMYAEVVADQEITLSLNDWIADRILKGYIEKAIVTFNPIERIITINDAEFVFEDESALGFDIGTFNDKPIWLDIAFNWLMGNEYHLQIELNYDLEHIGTLVNLSEIDLSEVEKISFFNIDQMEVK